MAVSLTYKIEAKLSGVWTDMTADVIDGSVSLKYGIDGDGPLDCVASTGELHFALRNYAASAPTVLGYYSPASSSKRAGWGFGVYVRASFTSGAYTNKIRFYGKIRLIAPEPGSSRGRRVAVVAYDIMRDLAEADAREVSIQTSKTESQLLTSILAALPTESQPLATSFDSGIDSYPVAFDNLKGDAKAISVMGDVVKSSIGLLCSNGDGTLCYRSRQSLSTVLSSFTFSNDMVDIVVPSSLEKVFNRARSTIHPKLISAAATDVLYTLPDSTSNPISVSPGATVQIWTDYSDPNDRKTKIGGTSVVTTLVSGTHYSGNSASNGGGSDLGSSLTVTLSPFSSTAKWSITNNHASAVVYITLLKVIGKAIRDPGPQTFEARASSITSDRPVNLDLPYQNDPYIGQSACDYTVNLYASLASQIEALEFYANASSTFMSAALSVEPGDRITVSESVTGVASVACMVRSVELRIGARGQMMCRFGVKPASTLQIWLLGTAGASELGSTTVLGF